jgi:hypothetical protein
MNVARVIFSPWRRLGPYRDTKEKVAMPMDQDHEIRLNEVEARQGSIRPKLVYVLTASIGLVIVAFLIASLFYRH